MSTQVSNVPATSSSNGLTCCWDTYELLCKVQQLHRQPGVLWGGVVFGADHFSTNNKFAIGMPGSGKSLTFSMVMLSQLPWPQGARAPRTPFETVRSQVFQSVLYDAKSNQLQHLMAYGFTPGVNLFILNPLDPNAMVWDVASDLLDYADASDFAELIVSGIVKPSNYSETSAHFHETAQLVVTEVIQVLQQTPNWRLRDLVNCFHSRERIRSVLKQHPSGGTSLDHINDGPEGASALSTIKRYVHRFNLVAASWDAIERRHGQSRLFSLTAWAKAARGTVLLLPDGDEYSAVTRPFNNFIMGRLKKLFMRPSELGSVRPRTIFFDELPTAGKIDALTPLLRKGRDYGISLTLGVQDIGDMRDVYGNELTNSMVNACGFRAYMKCKGSTAEWCSHQIGRQIIEYASPNASQQTSTTSGRSQTIVNERDRQWLYNYSQTITETSGYSSGRMEQFSLMPSIWHQMPDIRESQSVNGVYEVPSGDVWGVKIPLRYITETLLGEVLDREDALRDCAEPQKLAREDQFVRKMTASDCTRLGLNNVLEATPKRRMRRAKALPPPAVEQVYDSPPQSPVKKRPPICFNT